RGVTKKPMLASIRPKSGRAGHARPGRLTQMSKMKKVLATLVVVGVVGVLAAFGTFSAFSSTTSNPGNEFKAGTVTLADNDTGTALYNNQAAKPGTTVTSCINVTYTGSLDADVRLYVPDTIGALGPYTNLTI